VGTKQNDIMTNHQVKLMRSYKNQQEQPTMLPCS